MKWIACSEGKSIIITLGEILLRLSTPINGRLAQGDTFLRHLGGAELNIASEIEQLGLKTAMTAASAFTTMNTVLTRANRVLSMTENILPLTILD